MSQFLNNITGLDHNPQLPRAKNVAIEDEKKTVGRWERETIRAFKYSNFIDKSTSI